MVQSITIVGVLYLGTGSRYNKSSMELAFVLLVRSLQSSAHLLLSQTHRAGDPSDPLMRSNSFFTCLAGIFPAWEQEEEKSEEEEGR